MKKTFFDDLPEEEKPDFDKMMGYQKGYLKSIESKTLPLKNEIAYELLNTNIAIATIKASAKTFSVDKSLKRQDYCMALAEEICNPVSLCQYYLHFSEEHRKLIRELAFNLMASFPSSQEKILWNYSYQNYPFSFVIKYEDREEYIALPKAIKQCLGIVLAPLNQVKENISQSDFAKEKYFFSVRVHSNTLLGNLIQLPSL